MEQQTTVKDEDLETVFRRMTTTNVDEAVMGIRSRIATLKILMPDCVEAISRLEATASILEAHPEKYSGRGGMNEFIQDVAKENAGKQPLPDQYSKILVEIRKHREMEEKHRNQVEKDRNKQNIKDLLQKIDKQFDEMK